MPDAGHGPMTRSGWARAPRDVVLVDGPDGGTFLHSQFANDIASLAIGGSCQSLVLEPTGHLSVVARVCRQGDERWVFDVDGGHGQRAVDRLSRYVLRARVSMSLVDWECRTFVGTEAVGVAEGHLGRCAPWWGDVPDVVDVVASRDQMPDTGGLSEIDEAAWDMMRVDSRWPRLDVDVSPGDVPSATGVVARAVSFTKGCYPGQELVERMDSRGAGAPWSLRWLPSREHVAGDVLTIDGAEAAVVTSVGNERALVRVRRGHDIGHDLGSPA